MLGFFQLLSVFTPQVIGAAFFVGCWHRSNLTRVSFGILVISGAYVGTIYWGGILWWLDLNSATVLNEKLTYTSAFASCGGSFYLYRKYKSVLANATPCRVWELFVHDKIGTLMIGAYLVSICLSSLYLVLNTSTSGWDSLDWWYYNASRFIKWDGSDWGLASVYPYKREHPASLFLVYAYYADIMPAGYGGKAVSILGSLITFTLVLLLCIKRCLSSSLTLLVLLVVAVSPLCTNHFLIGGYSEAWLALAMLCAISLVSIWREAAGFFPYCSALAVVLAPLLVKNTGLVFAAVIACSFLATWFVAAIMATGSQRNWFLVVRVAFPVLIVLLLALLSINWATYLEVSFAGRTWLLSPHSFASVFYNWLHASIINSSFSLFSVTVVFCGAWWMRDVKERGWDVAQDFNTLYCLVMYVGLTALFVLPQFFYDYAWIHSLPGQDTGFSRMLLPANLCGIAFAVAVVSRLTNLWRANSLSPV